MIFPTNVKVQIECPWHTTAVNIWFYWDAPHGHQVWNAQTNEIMDVPDGKILDTPSLVLPNAYFLKALGEKAAEVAEPNIQMAAHLKDACAVRDKLLTIVDRLAK